MSAPRFASSLSTSVDTDQAIQETAEAISLGLEGGTPDLLCCFASHHHGAALASLGQRLQEACGAVRVLGCTGEHVLGARQAVAEGPALSTWAMGSTASQILSFDVSATRSADSSFQFNTYPAFDRKKKPFLILLGDPFSFPMGIYLQELNERSPGLPAIGGMASGGLGAGQNLLFREDGCQHDGALGVLVQGGVELHPVVSQGCRPVGRPYVITRTEGNLILSLGGRPAARVMHTCLSELSEPDRELFRHGPSLGLAVNPSKSEFGRGDFLVRGILGHRAQDDALAVADMTLRVGMTVQFLVRDAASASEDLAFMMKASARGGDPKSVGALVFSCNLRSDGMFESENHDIGCIQAAFEQPIPAAGFFAMGEIGPVGDQNFLHGFTASVGIVRASDETIDD